MNLSRFYKISFLFVTICFFNCSSNNEECLKTETIQQFYGLGGFAYNYNVDQEIPCDVDVSNSRIEISPPLLNDFTYEVLNYEHIEDTGNNTSKTHFEIKLNNPNEYAVDGFPYFTLLIDGATFSNRYQNLISSFCTTLNANSSCTLMFDMETQHSIVGIQNSVEIKDIKYYLTKE